ncbi:MAG: GlcNAc-PI de-N-acetylase [Chloroflexi bacterium]|nr:MAG: GlcNAc-PI de-N-acetylase [Chloroflexota bacterium]MBL1195739.1 GlcNAc-PI de-N-acetylase [Chloroflexota bacterium]NOH13028.1 GlcNAc-PI de-N-acetylase [Chloroflexota bacterium]
MASKKNKSILVSLAHPDDESFGMGGTLAYYASQGVDVYLICATNGDVGTVSPEFMNGYDTIAELRQAELSCAAQHLGLKDVILLNYRDSGMAGTPDNEHPDCLVAAPLDEVAEKVTHYIRKLQPDVVITFDPVGGYHHPDHIAIYEATQKAYEAANDPDKYPEAGAPFQPQALYYHVFPRRFLRLVVRVLKLLGRDPSKFGRNEDIDLEMLAGDEDYPRHVEVDFKPVADKQKQAAQCHASQLDMGPPSLTGRIFNAFRSLAPSKDSFMRAYPPTADDFHATDLFVN